jgi:hypothetical protein
VVRGRSADLMGDIVSVAFPTCAELERAQQREWFAVALSRRPGWFAWGVRRLMDVQEMCPACLEIGGQHAYWCRIKS